MGSLFNRLEGKKHIKDTQGGQYIFQQGRNNIFACDELWSVNNPWYYLSLAQGDAANTTAQIAYPSDTNTVYKWGEKMTLTLQNHSLQPIYVTAKFLRPKQNMPVIGTSAATPTDMLLESQGTAGGAADEAWTVGYGPCGWVYKNASTKWVNDAKFRRYNSNIVRMIYNGIEDIDKTQEADTIAHRQLVAANTGLFDTTQAGSPDLNIGEGIGSVTSKNSKLYGDVDTYSSNSCGLGVPLGVTSGHSPYFREMFGVYELKRFVLQPEEHVTLSLSDVDMKYMRKQNNSANSFGVDTTVEYPWGPFGIPLASLAKDAFDYAHDQYSASVFQPFQKYIQLEVHGSLMGQDVFATQAAIGTRDAHTHTTGGYAPTELSSVDVTDMRVPGVQTTTHGGVLRWLVHKEMSFAELTNEEREELQLFKAEGMQIPVADEAITMHSKVDH